MNVVNLKDLKRERSGSIIRKRDKQKNHAELLREAFLALEKHKVPQMYKIQ